jgi:hypothetical protein
MTKSTLSEVASSRHVYFNARQTESKSQGRCPLASSLRHIRGALTW